MQSQNSASSTINNMVAGLGTTNIVQIQPANPTQPNTQYVTLDMNNRAQIINLPTQQAGQYIAVQSRGFQVIPVQGANAQTQYVQLQIPNLQQAGANFIQLQAPTNQTANGVVSANTNLNQTFIPVQPIANQSQIGNNDNQRVSIQLVQQPGNSPKRVCFAPSLVGSRSTGESTSAMQTSEPSNQQQQTIWPGSEDKTEQNKASTPSTSPSKTVTTSTSTLFQALQQAASVQQASTISLATVQNPSAIVISTAILSKNVVTKTFSASKLPNTNYDQIMKPSIKTIAPSTINKNENKPIKAGTIVVVSAHNQHPINISKTQTPNPVFVPITMANNVSVLTNQTSAVLASKRMGQAPQAIPIRIQQQIAPRVTPADGQATIAPANIGGQPQQPKFIIPVHSSVVSGQQANQEQQILFQPSNLVRFASQLVPPIQQKKDALANIVPAPKLHMPVPTVTSSSGMQESKPFKKPCNCTKSQCLKLYCECFANGEFCNNCNCRMCLNNIEHEAERSKAIKNCLDRNPQAFHPKIGKGKVKGDNERRHTKGCNCKRSGCLKNYCECYEAKILCSSLCRCNGCKNFEESDDRKTLMQLADAAEARVLQQNAAKSKLDSQIQLIPKKRKHSAKERLPLSFITADVSKATCDILLATASEVEKNNLSDLDAERSLVIEFSRCLDQIIDKSNKALKGKR